MSTTMRTPALFCLATALATASLGGPARADDVADHAKKLLRSAIVVDTHLDAPDQLSSKYADIANRGATDHFDLPRAREGGLTAPFFSIYVSASYADHGAAKRALELIDLTNRVIAEHPKDTMLAVSVADVRKAKKDGKLGILMGIEGGHAIEDSLGVLREMYRAGVRYMTLTHTNTNHWADSSGKFYLPDFNPAEYSVHGGLSDFGRVVVREMNRLGMMVDVSHVSDDTIDDALETSRAPIFASLSSCRALCGIPRNLTDDQIRRIAAKGGVVMINVSSYFVDPQVVEEMKAKRQELVPEYLRIKQDFASDPKKRDEAIGKLFDRLPRGRTSWTKVVDHIEHALTIGGPEAVGLGTDFDGIEDPPEGLEDVSKLPVITAELLRRGHSEKEVEGVLGENFLRFFRRVEETARSLKDETASTVTLTPR